MNSKKIIILMTAIVLVVSSLGIYGNSLVASQYKGQVSTILSFNFDGIDEGLNPHGGTFDIQAFKEADVLDKVVEELKLADKGIDAKSLAENMIVKGYVPKDVMDRILPKGAVAGTSMEQVANSTYHPTQYEVILQIPRDMKLNKKQAKAFMDTFVTVYQDYFVNKYKDTKVLDSAITQIDPERYDYSEYISLIEGQLDIVKEYLAAKEQKAKGFKSPTTGKTFSDLVAQVDLIKDVEIGNIKALVDTFVITKDINELRSIYQNRLYKMKKDKEQYLKEATTLRQATATYKKDPTVILDNGVIAEVPKEEEKDKEKKEIPVYEDLVQKTVEVEAKVNSLTYQIQYHEELLSRLNSGVTSEADIKRYTKEVDDSITYVSNVITEAMKTIKETTDEYYTLEVFEKSVEQMQAAKYTSSFRLKLIKNTLLVGVITGFGMLLSFVYVLVKKK